ncbi:hypothetical protein PsAD2_01993 [Pseudovibrio axinellae]|uniref:Exostosin family protein n=1 Tax=Pseudovibrio axinellae TaxID=989403 RepID=A0A165YUA6_9HYPH|nr:hypothetical protein [Pseudovibrio axinellae]KZL19242.1 hypothetical protein PsAD2_01993 [Pseudovibrio axinellae]SEQ44544.1 hypothetical protein SAMN05421798_102714 [Pseudovibrio axinellae]
MALSLLNYKSYQWMPRNREETCCKFISSRGFAKCCVSRNRKLKSSIPALDQDLLEQHKKGATLYITTDALPDFVRTKLTQIREPFVLLSGDSDLPIGADVSLPNALPPLDLQNLLNHPLLVAWFAQNLTIKHDKLFNLPIGLDYHTLTQRKSHAWGAFQSPLEQEERLRQIVSMAPPLRSREIRGYCNWHHAVHRGDRREVLDVADDSVAYYESDHLPRDQSWRKNAQFLFTISPFGEGMDCHRTWEALFLGAIPIVKSSGLNPLFVDLPVVIIEDWKELTKERLLQERDDILARAFDFSSLFLSFWKNRFQGRKPVHQTPVSYQEFLSTL